MDSVASFDIANESLMLGLMWRPRTLEWGKYCVGSDFFQRWRMRGLFVGDRVGGRLRWAGDEWGRSDEVGAHGTEGENTWEWSEYCRVNIWMQER